MKQSLLYAAALSVSATAGVAQTYDCKATSMMQRSFVPERVILAVDPRAQAGSAFDAFIQYVKKAPIPVELKKRSDTSYRLSWTLEGLPSGNSENTKVSYSVVLNMATGRYNMTGRVHGYDNIISASGPCQLVK